MYSIIVFVVIIVTFSSFQKTTTQPHDLRRSQMKTMPKLRRAGQDDMR